MAYYKATIEILVDVGCEAEACDCISETMRPLLREFAMSAQLPAMRIEPKLSRRSISSLLASLIG